MKRSVVFLLSFLSGLSICHAELVEKAVDYKNGDLTFEGVHVYDTAVKGKRPAVLVVHQRLRNQVPRQENTRMIANYSASGSSWA